MANTEKNANRINVCRLANAFGEIVGGVAQNGGPYQNTAAVHPYMQLNEKGDPLETGVGWAFEEICEKLRKNFKDSSSKSLPLTFNPDGFEAEAWGIGRGTGAGSRLP